MATFTAFCQETGGGGTIWISSVEAPDAQAACTVAAVECATEWGCDVEDVWVLGIAEGDINILIWEDQEG